MAMAMVPMVAIAALPAPGMAAPTIQDYLTFNLDNPNTLPFIDL